NQGDFGNCFVKLSTANSSLQVADYWTMFNTVQETTLDSDLGAGGPLVLPDMTDSNGNTRHLAVGSGKDGHIYIADRDNMGKFNPNSNNIYQDVPVGALNNQVFCSPAFFNGHLYYAEWTRPLRSFNFVDARLDPTAKAI